jgi:hypothetical protein
MTYTESKEYALKHNITSASEWFNHSKSFKISPAHPERSFKDVWVDWFDFLSKPTDNRKFIVNDDFFKNESPNMAYILGFWAADGSINHSRQFSITQNKNDEYLLIDILNVMESDCVLKNHGNNSKNFNITSNELINDLKQIFKYDGKDKTYTIKFPQFKNNNLYGDFIRGFFDGDGCVTYQKNEKCYVSNIICANKMFLNDLVNSLYSLIPEFNGKFNQNGKYFYLTMGVNDTRRFRDFIYKNINHENKLYLKRKKNKFYMAGDVKIASFMKIFLPYEKAKIFVKETGIKKYKEWKKYKKENKILDIPSNMEYYSEYTTWGEFMR